MESNELDLEYEKCVQLLANGHPYRAYQGLLYCAKMGIVDAMWDIGSMLLQGKGCQQDINEAEDWLTKATIYNNDGRIFLGDLYCLKGHIDKALLNYQLAINDGDDGDKQDAYCAMGDCYLQYMQNEDLAKHYYKLAGPTHSNSLLGIAKLYEKASNHKKSVEFYEYSASLNNIEACSILAMYYKDGFIVNKDFKKAAELFHKSNNNKQSQYELGLLYIEGIGVDKSIEMGIDLLLKSAVQGYEPAKLKLKHFVQETVYTTQSDYFAKVKSTCPDLF